MGRIGGWFKKSDDKGKSAGPAISNPYAQQPGVGGQTPPPQYDQYTQFNNNQFSDNQSIPRPPPPNGLPSGPRPGGLPARVAPGPARSDTLASTTTAGFEKTPPPQYSPNVGQLPPYDGGSAGATGFPREKYGAADGFGRNRFDGSGPSRFDNPTSAPRQSQGGYGNLDDGGNALFAGYNGPAKPAPRPGIGQTGGSYDPSMEQEESRPMTEEELEQAQINDTKAEIIATQQATNRLGRNLVARLDDGEQQFDAMLAQLMRQGETLDRAEQNVMMTRGQADVGAVNMDDLDAANAHMLNFVANSKNRIAQRAEKKMTIQQQTQMQQEQAKREQYELQRQLEVQERALDATRPKILGGGGAKKDFSRFEFEDDDGQQRANNEEHDEILDRLAEGAHRFKKRAMLTGVILDQQNAQISRMTEQVEVVDDKVTKNRIRLDTTYNKR